MPALVEKTKTHPKTRAKAKAKRSRAKSNERIGRDGELYVPLFVTLPARQATRLREVAAQRRVLLKTVFEEAVSLFLGDVESGTLDVRLGRILGFPQVLAKRIDERRVERRERRERPKP